MQTSDLELPHDDIYDSAAQCLDKLGEYTTYHNKQVNDQWFEQMPAKDSFIKQVKEAALHFTRRTGRQEFTGPDDMYFWGWVSRYHEHDEHGAHMHPKSLISGTYYPYADEHSSRISFEIPYLGSLMHDTMSFNRHVHAIKPYKGLLILWPSFLLHRVPSQTRSPETKQRMAISFNIDYMRYHRD